MIKCLETCEALALGGFQTIILNHGSDTSGQCSYVIMELLLAEIYLYILKSKLHCLFTSNN